MPAASGRGVKLPALKDGDFRSVSASRPVWKIINGAKSISLRPRNACFPEQLS